MIHRLLRAALAVAALSSFSAAQEGGSTSTGTPRVERPMPPKAKGDAATAAARERLQKFLAEHPEVREKLKAQADADGDGKLDAAEKKRLYALVEHRMREAQDRREDRRDERQEDRREERRDERREERRERADRDGDGRVEPAEKKRAQQVRGKEGCEDCREKPAVKSAVKSAEKPRSDAKSKPKSKPAPRPTSEG